MTPVYKLSASSITGRTTYGSMLAGNPAFSPSSYESIATYEVGSGGAADIEFTSIPSTYTHLQLRIFAQTNRTTYAIDQCYIRFNSDTGSNYSWHFLTGDGQSVDAVASTSQIYIRTGDRAVGTSVSPGTWGSQIIDILDYANTFKYKTIRTLAGCDTNGAVAGFAGMINLASGLWRDTSAITSIKIAANGGNFTQYTSAALYGIKGA